MICHSRLASIGDLAWHYLTHRARIIPFPLSPFPVISPFLEKVENNDI
jgi:hypothetical protein